MAKEKKQCCVLTLRLEPEKWQEDVIEKRFKIMEHLKNSLIAFEMRKLKNLERTRVYKDLQQRIENTDKDSRKELYTQRRELLKRTGFTKYDFVDDITLMQKHFIEHFAAQIAHRTAADTWEAFEKMLYGTGKKVHFLRRNTLDSIACKKEGNGMRFRDGFFVWSGGQCKNKISLKIKVAEPATDYERAMLERDIKYLRIVRKWSKTKYKYYLQITFDGVPVGKKREIAYGGRVGIDIGPSTVAIASEEKARLMELADHIQKNHEKKIMLQRGMDRSRRICNRDNFNENGTVKRGVKLHWNYSKHYLKMKHQVKELERKNAAIRKYQHTCLANEILSMGTEVYVEKMNFLGLQHRARETTYDSQGRINRKKRFGKSLANRAPSMFLQILNDKLSAVAGTELHNVNTTKFRASQYDHTTGVYTKKKLNDRWTELGNGDHIQRDLYSAFLLMNSAENMEETDNTLCNETYQNFKKLHDMEINRIVGDGKPHPKSFGLDQVRRGSTHRIA